MKTFESVIKSINEIKIKLEYKGISTRNVNHSEVINNNLIQMPAVFFKPKSLEEVSIVYDIVQPHFNLKVVVSRVHELDGTSPLIISIE